MALAFCFGRLTADAKTADAVLASGGISLYLSEMGGKVEVKAPSNPDVEVVRAIADVNELSELCAEYDVEIAELEKSVTEKLVVAQTDSYIVVYEQPDLESEAVGKLYNDCIGTIIEESTTVNPDTVSSMSEDIRGGRIGTEETADFVVKTAGDDDSDGVDWYLIESGNVRGYILVGENLLTGDEASTRKEEIGKCYALIDTESLFVRTEADCEADIVEIVTRGDEIPVISYEDENWIQVETEYGEGWIDAEYAELTWKYEVAETKEEEKERLAELSRTKGEAMVAYAVQFVGNRYVWGGVSLTEGADCSGFTLTLYGMYGVSLPHSSITQAEYGEPVDGIENALPGDLIVFDGHVAIYMGDGKIVHAANSRDGIIISGVDFMPLKCIRRLL